MNAPDAQRPSGTVMTSPVSNAHAWTMSPPVRVKPGLKGIAPSASRLAVENLLRSATPANPLTAAQVAKQLDLPQETVRRYIGNICTAFLAYSINPGQHPAQYAGGVRLRQAPEGHGEAPTPAPYRAPLMDATHYQAAELRPFEGRPGAMRAFELPSLVDGQRVERQRPALIGKKPDGHFKALA